MTFWERLMPSRRSRLQADFASATDKLRALYESWAGDSLGIVNPEQLKGSWLEDARRVVIDRHNQLLEKHRLDVDKYLYRVPVELAKFDGEYSWQIRKRRREETDRLVDGMLGNNSPRCSLGLLVRCAEAFPDLYSRDYLVQELERRLEGGRPAPKPGFQWTLDYARTLDGSAFEDWLVQLLRDSGINGVVRTQASRDQGADVVVTLGAQKIIIQAKQVQDTVGNSAVQEVFAALPYYQGTQGWVVTTSCFSKDAINLAHRANVQLVPGSQLLNLPDLIRTASVGQPDPDNLPDRTIPPVGPKPEEGTPERSTNERASPTTAPPLSNVTEPDLHAPESANSIQSHKRFHASARLLLPAAALLVVGGLAVYLTLAHAGRSSVERDVRSRLAVWTSTMLSGDVAGQVDCYAPVVAPFFQRPYASRGDVAAAKVKMNNDYPTVMKYVISDIKFLQADVDRAVVSLDKEWEAVGERRFAGKEREQIELKRADGQWRISAEREIRVYWVQSK